MPIWVGIPARLRSPLDTRELVFEHVPFLGDYPQQEPGIDCAYHWPGAVPGKDSRPSGSSPTPFWRKQGLDGSVLSLDDEFHVLDNSPPESSCGGLACFIEAAHARTATEMTGNERRKLITSML